MPNRAATTPEAGNQIQIGSSRPQSEPVPEPPRTAAV
jgi:hypothetical protein